MRIYTIGFTGKSAEEFFTLLQSAEAAVLLDIRVHNRSQLAGFTRRDHMPFLTENLTNLRYIELPILAPESDLLKQYRTDGDWDNFEVQYLQLLVDRNAVAAIDRGMFSDGVVLMCSEPTAEKCHRRLAADHLRTHVFADADIIHL